ncbi:E3 ubiquitin-protein ligase RMA1H1-like [Bidens hawaiensis]|uniref:E3 ubiquitin-protein ligase RMA1H1-like n=1 Tax=Bidens hawaiensis TaxID=980011 RepID=UPI00404BA065
MEFENYIPDELSPVSSHEKSLPCFDCSICLDFAKDPVVTLCGHLYCWPCIYKWLSSQTDSDNNPLCPVCKSEISHTSVVPLYGRGKTLPENEPDTKTSNTVIPPRPRPHTRLLTTPNPTRQFAYGNSHQTPYTSYNHNSTPGVYSQGGYDSNVWMYGDMIYARVFGNSQRLYAFPNSYHLAGSNNPRLRRQEMQVHRSLNRLTIFLYCCLFLCLLLF